MKKDQLPDPLWGGGWSISFCLPGRDCQASLSQKAGPSAGTGSSQLLAVFRLGWLWWG
ncbi:hypothetical protein [Abiotrophia sp. HMSC24B09]|uniref:hypothetical protein n=1 Tax=Abiotrophia sp. HMSC24B09 TaxID=1581061 RepID=UPI0015D6699C|nr:hypothetical protein [Abiotrophia sp. HMSC24B09]